MKTIIISLFSLSAIMSGLGDKLSGYWETKPSVNGVVTSVRFISDSTFEGFLNKKPFVTAKYSLKDDVFSFIDNGCEGMRGTYKVIFFRSDDSLRFETISDSCTARREGMERLRFGRVSQ
jgi:hypothetical protein